MNEQLSKLIEGLYYMSESDYPFEIIQTDVNGVSPEEILKNYLAIIGNENTSIEKRSVADFFRHSITQYPGMSEEELATVARFQALVDFLVAQCGENIEVFRLGNEPEIHIYIIGKSNGGENIILKTISIET